MNKSELDQVWDRVRSVFEDEFRQRGWRPISEQQGNPIEKAVSILRRRAAGYQMRDLSIYNGRIIAEELKSIARDIEALAESSGVRALEDKQ